MVFCYSYCLKRISDFYLKPFTALTGGNCVLLFVETPAAFLLYEYFFVCVEVKCPSQFFSHSLRFLGINQYFGSYYQNPLTENDDSFIFSKLYYSGPIKLLLDAYCSKSIHL